MLQLLKNKDYYGTGLFLLLVVTIGYQQMVSPAIGIFLVIFLVEGFVFKSYRFKFSPVTALFVLLFLFYMAGLAWSEHRDVGWKLLEYKMSFFIFPLLFLLHKQTSNAWLILQGLIWGSIFLAARFLYFDINSMELISYYELSRQHILLHPSYASIYFTLTTIFLVYALVNKQLNWPVFVSIPLILVFSFLVVMIGSFAGILFLGICLAIGFFFLVYFWLRWKGVLVALLVVPFAFYFTITRLDQLKYDIEMITHVYHDASEGKEYFLEKNRVNESGTVQRMTLWYTSAEIITGHPFGVGLGDIDFALAEKFDKYGLDLLKKEPQNPHNQFLQIGIDIGFPGIAILLVLIFSVLFVAIKGKNYFLFFIGLSLFFNALFESVLQRQSGIVFYTFVICLVVVYNDQFRNNFVRRQIVNPEMKEA